MNVIVKGDNMYVIKEYQWGNPDIKIEGQFEVGYYESNGKFYVEESISWERDARDDYIYQESVQVIKGNAQKKARALCSRLNGGR